MQVPHIAEEHIPVATLDTTIKDVTFYLRVGYLWIDREIGDTHYENDVLLGSLY